MKFNTHKDLLIDIEKKELEKYMKVKKEIEEVEARLLKREEKISEKEVKEVFRDDAKLQQLMEKPTTSLLSKVKEILPNLKKIEKVKAESDEKKKEIEKADLKKHVEKLNKIVELDEKKQKEYDKIISKLEEQYFDMKSQLVSQIHLNHDLKDKIGQIKDNKDKADLLQLKVESNAEAQKETSSLAEQDAKLIDNISIKNTNLMHKIEAFVKKNKDLEHRHIDDLNEIEKLKKINLHLSQELDRIENQNALIKQKFQNYEHNELALNIQIQELLREKENVKDELNHELDGHDKTITVNDLLKEENKLLKLKIKDLNTHIHKLSEGLHQALKKVEEKDRYYPALFESSNIANEDEMNKMQIQMDSYDLQLQMKENLLRQITSENEKLKQLQEEKENYTANAIEKIIEKSLN